MNPFSCHQASSRLPAYPPFFLLLDYLFILIVFICVIIYTLSSFHPIRMPGHVKQVLDDAYDYKEHAGKEEIGVADVHLAMKNILSQSFTQPPPPQLLHSLYQERNNIPLDVVPTRFGVLLPPNKHCLTSANYQLEPEAE
jgi:hypothetical protein